MIHNLEQSSLFPVLLFLDDERLKWQNYLLSSAKNKMRVSQSVIFAKDL